MPSNDKNSRAKNVSRTFSKVYGLAGLRLGYAVASPKIADSLRRYATVININGMVSAAAMAGLQDSDGLAVEFA